MLLLLAGGEQVIASLQRVTDAQERNQFGRPISTFQANAFKLADMAMEIDCARLLLYRACWLKDQNQPFTKEAAMAKLYCSEVMGRVANHAVQLHGGYGYCKDYRVERLMRDAKITQIWEGTNQIHRQLIGRSFRIK